MDTRYGGKVAILSGLVCSIPCCTRVASLLIFFVTLRSSFRTRYFVLPCCPHDFDCKVGTFSRCVCYPGLIPSFHFIVYFTCCEEWRLGMRLLPPLKHMLAFILFESKILDSGIRKRM